MAGRRQRDFRSGDLSEELDEGLGHYAVALRDPEGNEFDIN